MLATRLIPTLLYKDSLLVKGRGFDSWRRIGAVIPAMRVYDMRGVDELIFLDIAATEEGRAPDFEAVKEYADCCFMPLAVGGGVRTVDDVRKLLMAGADKVTLNTEAARNPKIISEIAETFGSQCVVVSIDAKRRNGGGYEVYTHSGKEAVGLAPAAHAKKAEEMGAGEIIVTAIDRDGLMEGYDLDLIRAVSDAVSIPVIASGGAGCFQDFVDAVAIGRASAVAAASIFHFTETTPLEVKAHMKKSGLNVRM